jgi:hypothetical protein
LFFEKEIDMLKIRSEFRAFRSEADLFGYSRSVFVFLWLYVIRRMRWLV